MLRVYRHPPSRPLEREGRDRPRLSLTPGFRPGAGPIRSRAGNRLDRRIRRARRRALVPCFVAGAGERSSVQREGRRERPVGASRAPRCRGGEGLGARPVPEPRDGATAGKGAPGVVRRHRGILPSPGSLHIDDGRARGGERLSGPDPERMPGDSTLDSGIRGPLGDDGPNGPGADALGGDVPAPAHASEHGADPVARGR